MPFNVRCYEILRRRRLAEAAAIVTEGLRSCSANFVLAQTRDRAMDIEAAPDRVRVLDPRAGTLVHANHFVDPSLLGVVEPEAERRPHSYTRHARLTALLEARAPVAVGDLQVMLQDHDNYPDGICRHAHPDDPPEEWCVTVTSAILDLEARSVRLADGQPCAHLYEEFSLES